MELIERADKVFKDNFPSETWFERAVFISWYCAKPTCKFCYMYTIKDQIKNPRKSRRRLESILAEALITKICCWEIGFVSAGIASWSTRELRPVLEGIFKITGKKQWLNLGVMKEAQIKGLLPFLEGVTGTVECVNEKLRDIIVSDKPLDRIDEMFKLADKYKIKKSITIIIGLGETIEDFPRLAELIRLWNIDRLNFYRLVPHEGAELFPVGPKTEYYIEWIAKTRIEFPKLEIVAGSWPDKTKEIPLLLKAGANGITKLPAIKLFGKKPAIEIEEGARKAGRKFLGTLTKYPDVDIDEELSKLNFDDDLK
ncbi:radical SAM protein, partial [Candidatus Woesearchaeota archaeon]|nr:radical SAM protein [Candidatus Woesearchaeota archaeon]